MSTVHPDITKNVAEWVQKQGASFVAAPVFGAPIAAVTAKLMVAVAGPKPAKDKVTPYFDGVMGRATLDVGQAPEKASLLKLVGATFIASIVQTTAEGLTMAETSGLGTDVLQQYISTLFTGSPFELYCKRMLSGAYIPGPDERPAFQVDLAIDSMQHAVDIGQAGGASMGITRVTLDHLQKAKEELGEKGDISSVYGACRKDAGLPFSNKG